MLIPFPFEDGQCIPVASGDELSRETQIMLNRCFVDASFVSVNTSVPEGEWPAIGDIGYECTRSVKSISFDVRAFGRVFRISQSACDDPFPIVSGHDGPVNYVITLSSEGIRDFCTFGESQELGSPITLSSPPSTGCSSPSWQGGVFWLRMCAKCVNVRQLSTYSIEVYDGMRPAEFGTNGKGYLIGDICWRNGFHRCVSAVAPWSSWKDADWEPISIQDVRPSFTLSGEVKLRSGNNIRMAGDDEDENSVELNAEPGAGLGRIPCQCDDKQIPWAILMAGPDGHMRIFNDTCYDLEPSTTTGVLKMHAKCTACCTCEMYESIVNDKLAGIAKSVRESKGRIRKIVRSYDDHVKMFNSMMGSPRESDIDVTLSGMPIGANVSPKIKNKNVKGRMQRCSFTAVIRNSSFFTVTVSGLSISGTDSIVEASAAWSDSNGNPKSKSGDNASAITSGEYSVYPGRSLVIMFISAKNNMVNSVSTGGYVGRISASVYYGSSLVGSYSKSVSV